MKLGVLTFPTAYGIGIGTLARAVETRGFDSLFVCDHTHIPVGLGSATPGAAMPRHYREVEDPLVAMSFAAAATTTLKLGTAVVLVPHRDPIIMAKQVASLDVLSGGRVILGLGAGWVPQELENHGVAFADRFKVLREHALAMKAMWTEEEAEFHGEFVDFDPLYLAPKPAQRPHPPLLLGGETDHTLRRVVEFGDGWMPRAWGKAWAAKTEIQRLTDMASAAGRDPASLSVTVVAAPADPAALAQYAAAGVDRVLLSLPVAERDESLRILDALAPLMAGL